MPPKSVVTSEISYACVASRSRGPFTFIMLNVPAGLTLYIFVNNVLSIAQQQVMMKQQAVVAPAKG